MVFGDVGATEPPYTLRLSSTATLPDDVAQRLSWIANGLAAYREDQVARWGQDIEAKLEIVS